MMKGNQEGFTIVEAVIAMVLLSVVLTSLAGLTSYTAQMAVTSKDAMTRDGYALERLNRLDALPFASLPTTSSCDTVGGTRNQYRRCTTVTVAGNRRTFTLVTTPLQRKAGAVTYRFTRSAPLAPNPLCTTC